MGIIIPSIECQDSEVITFDKAIISKIEAYDSLLLYERDTVVPLYYHVTNIIYDKKKEMMEIEDYYNPISNVNNYTFLLTGNQTLVDLKYEPDDKKLDNFFEQCYLEYNSCKNDIYPDMSYTPSIQNKDIIKDVRAYVALGNGIIEEYTFEEYSNLKTNNNFADFRIRSINFIIENKGSISERNEIIYDGIFLYHNYYLENKTLKWDLEDDRIHNSIRFSEDNISVPIFNFYCYQTFEPVETYHADEIAKRILLNSFKRYYTEYENYENKENWYFFNSEPLIKIKLVLLEYSRFTDNKYSDKKKLKEAIEKNYSNRLPIYYIFNDNTIDTRINIVTDDNSSPEILQIDSNLPQYPNYYFEYENKLLWDTTEERVRNLGVRNLLLINYLNRRIEESGYIINFEHKYFKDDEKLKVLTKEDLEQKKENLDKLDSFLGLSKYYNEQLYKNHDFYENSKRKIYLTNSLEIERQRNFTEKLCKSLEKEIDKKEKIEEQIYTRISISLAITFGIVGILSLVLTYWKNRIISIIKIRPLTVETKEKSKKGIVGVVIIAAIIFFVSFIILGYLP